MSCFTKRPKYQRICPFCYHKLIGIYQLNLEKTEFEYLFDWCDHCHKKLYSAEKHTPKHG